AVERVVGRQPDEVAPGRVGGAVALVLNRPGDGDAVAGRREWRGRQNRRDEIGLVDRDRRRQRLIALVRFRDVVVGIGLDDQEVAARRRVVRNADRDGGRV